MTEEDLVLYEELGRGLTDSKEGDVAIGSILAPKKFNRQIVSTAVSPFYNSLFTKRERYSDWKEIQEKVVTEEYKEWSLTRTLDGDERSVLFHIILKLGKIGKKSRGDLKGYIVGDFSLLELNQGLGLHGKSKPKRVYEVLAKLGGCIALSTKTKDGKEIKTRGNLLVYKIEGDDKDSRVNNIQLMIAESVYKIAEINYLGISLDFLDSINNLSYDKVVKRMIKSLYIWRVVNELEFNDDWTLLYHLTGEEKALNTDKRKTEAKKRLRKALQYLESIGLIIFSNKGDFYSIKHSPRFINKKKELLQDAREITRKKEKT